MKYRILRVCLKELREARRWLRLIDRKARLEDDPKLAWALGESDRLFRIFVASIRTARQNQLHSQPSAG